MMGNEVKFKHLESPPPGQDHTISYIPVYPGISWYEVFVPTCTVIYCYIPNRHGIYLYILHQRNDGFFIVGALLSGRIIIQSCLYTLPTYSTTHPGASSAKRSMFYRVELKLGTYMYIQVYTFMIMYTKVYTPIYSYKHLDCCHRRYRRFHRYRRQNDPISCPMSRYRVVGVTRYRVMAYQPRYRVMLTPILTPILGIPRYWVSFHRYRTLNTRYRCQYRDQYRDARYRQLQQPILVSISDTISGDTRYRCKYRTQYRVSRYRGLRTSDIVINIGHDIGHQTASVLPRG